MTSQKVTALVALLFLLECQWVHAQYFNNYGGWGGCGGYGYPVGGCYDNDNDLDILLPILLIALCKDGGFGGPVPYPYAAGYGGGCGGCGGGCGGCGGCGGGCGGCGGGCGGCGGCSGCGGGCGCGCC